MKVKELIAKLENENPEADVYIDQECIQEVSAVCTGFCVSDGYSAPHVICINDDEKGSYGLEESAERVVVIE